MQNKTILVVDDDDKIRLLLRRCFEADGFAVVEADSRDATLAAVERKAADLMTLDLNLGHDNGFDIARDVRHISDVPIIMVTGKDDVIDRVVGLEIGADDYITKPFHVREVLARVKTVLRRTHLPDAPPSKVASGDGSVPGQNNNGDDGACLRFDGMCAALDRFELRDRNNRLTAMTSGDFKLLQVFLERPKRVLSREQLMDLTGGAHYAPLDRTIDNQVARLRKKIERDPSNPRLITTVRGIGYSFSCDVNRSAKVQSD